MKGESRMFRRRFLIQFALVISLALGAVMIGRTYRSHDRYPKNVSRALKLIPKVPDGAFTTGLLCRLGLAEDAKVEDMKKFPGKLMLWSQYRIAPDFVIELDEPYNMETWGLVKDRVTGILIRQEIRSTDGRVYYANLPPAWGKPSNGGHDMQEKVKIIPASE